ncbi:MAG: polysaccharide deacetylase family protein [Clostridia bacterium]|nr:polysaccharide deacetylase family protein [Clostridia bacterium]
MKKLNRKITIATNFVLVIIFTLVFAVSFFPEQIVPIYGGSNVSAIYHGNRENANVSLMFNVYEGTDVVNGIIDTLDEYDAKATFFVGGCWADDNESALKKIVESGHEIANHGYFHKDHKKLGYDKNKEEISLTGVIVEALCGAKMDLFAPPSGSFSETTLEAAFDLGYKVIMWSKDTIDWRDSDQDLLYKRATKNPENGDLILMHPKKHTLSVLPRVIEFYQNIGFNIVTVSENIAE